MEKRVNGTVLIVDDEDSNIYALQHYLEAMDLNVVAAKNGAQALSVLQKGTKVDVILLDMMMPVMDGYETLKALKENAFLKTIPVIAVTAKAMKGDKEKCMEAGAWDYLSKPLNMSLLLEKLNHWMV
jgi:two-component system, chemotaxis family, sensor kinase CheA